MINWITELVNKDGVRIGSNNVSMSVDNSKSASNSTIDPMYNPEDGKQLKNSTAAQRQQGFRKSPHSLIPMPTRANTSIDYMEDKKTNSKDKLKKSSKKRMDEYVRNIVRENFTEEEIKTFKSTDDIRKNGVPDIEVISEDNPVLVRKVKSLIDIIEKNQATGEQKGIILNYLINNIGTVDIPNEYKQEMLKKIR